MKAYEDYFSSESIIKLLCRQRIKLAKKRHEKHLLRDISLHGSTKRHLGIKKDYGFSSMFPPRRTWVRFNNIQRLKYKNSSDLNVAALYYTILETHKLVSSSKLFPPDWYLNLQTFILSVQKEIAGLTPLKLQPPETRPIKKEIEGGLTICRPISTYKLKERIIISLTAKYLIKSFDPIFRDSSLAFRATQPGAKLITHHDAIEKILEYRKTNEGAIWAAECDIKKFFDCINHRLIKLSFTCLSKKLLVKGIDIAPKAKEVFVKYLNSYTFNKQVFTLNSNQEFFKKFKLENGCFEWPSSKLESEFYPVNLDKTAIGVPQGGAISCFIANLILHKVDDLVLRKRQDKDLLYLRFCDDMIILHTDKNKCQVALNHYLKGVKQIKLLVHEPAQISDYNKEFWETKSKAPYKWANKTEAKGNVPWLAFVGYQIKYNGFIRVRKKSLEAEIKKQGEKTNQVLKAVRATDKTNINKNSRKSFNQQVYAIESRLISMAVGRVALHNFKDKTFSLCWTNGFKHLDYNVVVKSQLKSLDRSRSKQINRLKLKLSSLSKKSDGKGEVAKPVRYFGYPFSYYRFIKNKEIASLNPLSQ
ncbi:reverse transcriptase domain-containing protein [Rufibacter sp. XAAS-G3-1]|uniref:reverse transcriptase domain-containing protein n=1 Tax=Rufibacter sp. XAAS-G3-1 TaxID=2729134 RepID=UPI0015E6D27E|nr:reverse transcriptase domain-containing protein [Rufibacter sp. XAAS-G3-1]